MSRITIKDLARLLSVNPSTVSRALKDHPDISLKMRTKVKKLAEELGYTPNLQAVSFRRRQSRLIALLIPDMNMFFFPYIIKGIEEIVRSNGYHLMVLHSNDNLEGEIANLKICQNLDVEGLMVSVSSETKDLNHFSEILKQKTPIVFFDRVIENRAIPHVIIQDEMVAQQAVEHLIKQGKREICGVFGNVHLGISQQRFYGFKKALNFHQLPVREDFVIFSKDAEVAEQALLDLLQENKIPDAIFAMSDEVLVGVMQALQQHDIDIPDTTAVIAISNGVVPHFFSPSVTYVQHSGLEVGKITANVLFDLLHEFKIEWRNVVETRLITKEST